GGPVLDIQAIQACDLLAAHARAEEGLDEGLVAEELQAAGALAELRIREWQRLDVSDNEWDSSVDARRLVSAAAHHLLEVATEALKAHPLREKAAPIQKTEEGAGPRDVGGDGGAMVAAVLANE